MGKYSFSDKQDKRREERRPVPKPRKPILRKEVGATVSTKVRGLLNSEENKLVQNQAAEDIGKMQKFFKDAAKVIADNPKCWECNKYIPQPFYRAATAHILFKKIFKSVSTHPLNYLVLGAGCGCHDKTHRLDTFSKMEIFGEAVDRFRQFEHLITEKHKLLDEFRMYAEQYEQKLKNKIT